MPIPDSAEWRDVVNFIFEMFGGLCIIPSIVNLYKTKKVFGINWTTTMFFTTWGIWNLYFYPQEGLDWSFYGGVVLVTANAIWLSMLIYYKSKQ